MLQNLQPDPSGFQQLLHPLVPPSLFQKERDDCTQKSLFSKEVLFEPLHKMPSPPPNFPSKIQQK